MAAADFKLALATALLAGCTSINAANATFEGTRWHVTAINGRGTPATGDYHVEFSNGTIGGRFGCNGFGGRYAVSGELMRATEIRSTMMACSDPAGWSFSSRKLTLSNGAGSIALEPSAH
jgi:heat shock protein HslJ